jgi:dipeptidyl aminopeptidase/acylaminoacyl peptidase
VYVTLDDGLKREDSVKDIGALLDWVERQPDLDSSRVAVWGGSYGGYMTLASLIHYPPPRLVCGIDMVGISNFVTFLKNTSGYRRDLRRAKYGDERDPDMERFLQSVSPLTRASEIRAPLLIAQGLRDPRVPVSESIQIKEAVMANLENGQGTGADGVGASVQYILADDEGHGFNKKSNRDFYQCATILFLKQFLLPLE